MHKPWMDASIFIADVISEIGERPEGFHSLDRIDNDIGYFPGNIRWATWKEQANNKSNNHVLEFNGESKTISQWSEHLGIGDGVIRFRLKRGWSLSRALTAKLQSGPKLNKSLADEIKRFRGSETAKSTATRFGVSDQTVYDIWNGKRWCH